MSASANGREFYKVFIVGMSGDGKTYSSRNLDGEHTGFINIENKPLPYKNKYKYHARPSNIASCFAALKDFSANDDITCIVIDSFSAFVELLLLEARASKKGFDVWNLYNEEIGRFLSEIKKAKKEVFITGHYEFLNIEGSPEKRIKVKGKEMEGMIEKEFTIVLYTDKKFEEGKEDQYYFLTKGQGLSAKCPPDIFGPKVSKIPNDMNEVLKAIVKFV